MSVLRDKHYGIQLLFFGIITIGSALLMAGLGMLLGIAIYGPETIEQVGLGIHNTDATISYLRFFQGFTHTGIFLLPSIIFAVLASDNMFSYLNFDRKLSFINVLITFALIALAIPIVNYTYNLNQSMNLPAFMQGVEDWMKTSEDDANKLIELMVQGESISLLLVNLFIMAVLPAVGEELFFRGVLMRLFSRFIKNIHVNIIVIGFIFSFIHLQFYGFLPRFLLGILLGYVFYLSKTIWMPILLHFLNNGISVFAMYLYQKGNIETNPNEMESVGFLVAFLSTAITAAILVYMYRNRSKQVLWR